MDETWDEERALAFGVVLKSWRENAKISQRVLAECSGLSHTTIARLEAGKPGSRGKPVRPGADSIRALADALAGQGAGRNPDDATYALYTQLMQQAGYRVVFVSRPGNVHVVSSEGDEPARGAAAIRVTTAEIFEHLARLNQVARGGSLDEGDLELIRETLGALVHRYDPTWTASPSWRIHHLGSSHIVPGGVDDKDAGVSS